MVGQDACFGAAAITYEWSVVSGPSSPWPTLYLTALQRVSEVLILPAHTLIPGESYVFQCTLMSTSGPGIASNASTTAK